MKYFIIQRALFYALLGFVLCGIGFGTAEAAIVGCWGFQCLHFVNLPAGLLAVNIVLPTTLKGTKDQMGLIHRKMDDLVSKVEREKRNDFTAEEAAEYDRLKKEFEVLKRHRDRQDEQRDRNYDMGLKPVDTESHYTDQPDNKFGGATDDKVNPVFTVYTRTAPKNTIADWYQRNYDVKESHRNVTPGQFIRAVVAGPQNDIEKRVINESTPSSGGYAVPELIFGRILDNIRAESHVMKAGVQTVLLNSKSDAMIKIVGDPTASWVEENGDIAPTDVIFDRVTFESKKLVSSVDVTGEWLRDAINGFYAIELALTGAMSAEIDRAALLGSGTGEEPKGLQNYTNINAYSMGTNGAPLSSYDPFLEAIKLMYDDNAPTPDTAIMSPRTWLTLAKLKDSQNNPLQVPPALRDMKFLQTSKVPINQTQGSSSVASSVFLGGFKSLYFGSNMEMTIIPTTEKVKTKYVYGFLAVMRCDFQPFREQDFGVIRGIIP